MKSEATAVPAALGLTVSDTVRLMLTRVVREHALPFDPLICNAKTVDAMLEARRRGLPSFDSVEALMANLNAEDSADRPVQPRLQLA